jgi:ferritin-like metal-binding protein YciE
MAINSLKDVYQDQLQDLYSACKQSHEVTVELAEAAKNGELKDALHAGAEGIKDGLTKLEELCRAHDLDPEGEHCKGMEGLVAEARAHGLEEDFSDHDAQDAMIITQYQRMVHYALAGYGCLLAFAKRLGNDADVRTLETLLDDTYDGDRRMTQIATAGGVNRAAAA